jgi:hypothetical protein
MKKNLIALLSLLLTMSTFCLHLNAHNGPGTDALDTDTPSDFDIKNDDKLELLNNCDTNFYNKIELAQDAWSSDAGKESNLIRLDEKGLKGYGLSVSFNKQEQFFSSKYSKTLTTSLVCKDGSLKEIEISVGFVFIVRVYSKKQNWEFSFQDLAAKVQQGKAKASVEFKTYGFSKPGIAALGPIRFDVDGYSTFKQTIAELKRALDDVQAVRPIVRIVKSVEKH